MSFFSLRHRCFGTVFIFILFLNTWAPPVLSADTASEQEIQAAIIIKLIDFITWPESSFATKNAPFTIGIFGENYFEGLFTPFLGRQVQNRPFSVRHITDIEHIGSPQILIVSASERKRIRRILARLADKPVLTIGDFPDFSELGGLINFYRKPNNMIGFEINLETKQKSGLKISAFLMKMGKIIHTRKDVETP